MTDDREENTMCGITACVGVGDDASRVSACLRAAAGGEVESAGLAVAHRRRIDVLEGENDVARLAEKLQRRSEDGGGHVYLGSTGSGANGNARVDTALVHTDCPERLAVVHTGTIENDDALRQRLQTAGHRFGSASGTEVVSHLVEEYLTPDVTVDQAFRDAVGDLAGEYGIAMVHAHTSAIYATQQGSPLAFCVGDEGYCVVSDPASGEEFADRIAVLEDGDVVRATPRDYLVTTLDGTVVHRSPERVEHHPDAVSS